MESITVPPLGESITEGVIVRWIKNDGDSVAVDEAVLELETDKASVEIPSPVAGVLHQRSAAGDTVQVGDVVAQIDPTAGAKASQDEGAADATKNPAPVSASDSKKVEEEKSDSSDKASGAEIAAKEENDGQGRRQAKAADQVQSDQPLSPAVRRLVDENGLDPSVITGTGRGGRITKADVMQHLQGDTASETKPPRAPTPYPSDQPADADAPSGDVERIPMSRMRKRIAERLLEAQRQAAILTTFNEVDMSAVLSIRSRYKEAFEKRHGTRLGFMSFFAAACVAATRDVPRVNARIEGEEIVQPRAIHLGVAVGTERGLVVPVVHNADGLSFAGIEAEIARLAERAQNNKLSIADLSGGTFTISNGGVYGSLLSTPILNPPQSGILGMHKIEKRPIVVDDEIVIRPMMYLALSYDHRLIDGADAVTFLVRVKERIEAPEKLLLGL